MLSISKQGEQACRKARLFLFGLALFGLAGCEGDPNQHAAQIATAAGLQFRPVATRTYTLAAWVRLAAPGQPVTVYIEGDGLAYDADGFASLDPTPRKALGLTLAGRDPAANLIYLARPCQYIHAPRCHSSAEWTSRRFAEPAVAALDEALSRLVPSGTKINLVGYSGGGALAVLLAARRGDLASLRTVAGNLDPIGVNRFHHATEDLSAFDPDDIAPGLKALPQRHFVGRADKVVPASFARAFVRDQGPGACATVVEIDATHEEGWDAAWPALVRQPLDCPAN